jgi:hypothetical protein
VSKPRQEGDPLASSGCWEATQDFGSRCRRCRWKIVSACKDQFLNAYPSRSPPAKHDANERSPRNLRENIHLYQMPVGLRVYTPTAGKTTTFFRPLKKQILSSGGFPTAVTRCTTTHTRLLGVKGRLDTDMDVPSPGWITGLLERTQVPFR